MDLTKRGAAIALKRTGLSQREIGRRLEVPKSTIQQFFRVHRNSRLSNADLKDRRRSGRPRCTTRRQDRFIIRSITNDPSTDTSTVAAELPTQDGRPVSERTIRRRAAEAGLVHRVKRNAPLLTQAQRANRLRFAEAHINRTVDELKNVLFSDESSVECGENHGQHWTWRMKGEEWRGENRKQTIKFAGHVSFWCNMSAAGPGSMIEVDGTMTSARYLALVRRHVQQDGERLCGEHFTFQQDNHSAHNAEEVLDYIETQGKQLLNWPANSPDLSPIENMFACLKRNVAERNPRDIIQLREIAQEEWNSFSPEYTTALISSIPLRLQEVIQNRGGPTSY
ncbi:putative Transposable element Tcb2 transposase [Blattamonas nauphoetae]|uniref:Transposable element Tcb2 transposase n=1 Tax=Blattamonas nauphoetae TaxID=2049346 RepID=A0ABQ9Y493_9EUKA|nr:putative Transposable element Tcb2 transposase [Blattamonas nauphoetae]